MVAATALITVVAAESGAISGYATVVNAMADSMGLEGDYSYTSDFTQTSASIYACNPDSEGNPSHFVNDIGNGQYYDPWTGQIGNVSELTLATKGDLGGSRDLVYK